MNSRQLEYVVLLAQLRSFSLVSEKLNISQPALSKQIISLEAELGVKLFGRNIPLTLTPAGEHFVREAQLLLSGEEQLLRSMEEFRTGERRRLTIGVSPFRNLYMMPQIVSKIRQRYPGLQVFLREAPSDQLRKEAADGEFDFAIVNLPVDETLLQVTALEPETLALVVPTSMAGPLLEKADSSRPRISFSQCESFPFVTVAPGQEMRRLFDSLCARSGIVPHIAAEVFGGITSAWAMARGGVGATLLPLQFVEAETFDRQLTVFTLTDEIFSRQPVIVTRRNHYISEPAKYAMSLLMKTADDL